MGRHEKHERYTCDRCGKIKQDNFFVPTRTNEGELFCKVCWGKRSRVSTGEMKKIDICYGLRDIKQFVRLEGSKSFKK